MKKIFVLLLLLSGCSNKLVSKDEYVKVVFANDMHFLSDKLYGNEAYFKEMMENADGKLTEYSTQLMDELSEKVIESDADYFVVAGDLTFNGEKHSLIDIGKYFQKIEQHGISVMVIPGNHDINYPYAYDYSSEGEIIPTEQISSETFKNLMDNYGFKEALYTDKETCSYVYELSENLWFIFLDANSVGNYNRIPESTLSWMKEVLEKAEGKKVVSITHQNLVNQSEVLVSGFTIDNFKEVRDLLMEYGVFDNFSGHVHMQHTSKKDGFSDIAVGSVSVNPLRYVFVRFDLSRNFKVELKALENLSDIAYERFNLVTSKKIEKAFPNLDENILNIMSEFAVRINRTYFAGEPLNKEALLKEKGWELFKEYGKDSNWFNYLHSVLYEKS